MQNQCYRKAPRMISDESGRRFKETRGERLEIPVEFDENIASLLAKIEQKRKEKVMRLEAKMQEAARANADALETAKNSIISRNKRLNIDKSDSGSGKSAENSKTPAMLKDSIAKVSDTEVTNSRNKGLTIDNLESGSGHPDENSKNPDLSRGSDSEKCFAPLKNFDDTEVPNAKYTPLHIDKSESGSGKPDENSRTPEVSKGSDSEKCLAPITKVNDTEVSNAKNTRLQIDKSQSGSSKPDENSKNTAMSKDSINIVNDTEATKARNKGLNINKSESGSGKPDENSKTPEVSKGSDSEKCLATITKVNDTEVSNANNTHPNIDKSESVQNSLTPELLSGSNTDMCNISDTTFTKPDLLTEVTSTGVPAIMTCPQDAPISESQPDEPTSSSLISEDSSINILPGRQSQANSTDHDSSLESEQNEVYPSHGDINTVDTQNKEIIANKGMVNSDNSDENNNKSSPINTSGNDEIENVETVRTIESCETQSKDKVSCIDSNNVRDSGHEDNTSSVATSKTSSNSKDVSIEKIERSVVKNETDKLSGKKSKETEIRTKIAIAIINEVNGVEERKEAREKAVISSNSIEVRDIKWESSKQHEATNSFLQDFAGVIKDCSKSIAAKTDESLKVPSRDTNQNSDESMVSGTETADRNETLCDTAIPKSVIKRSLNTSQSHTQTNSGETLQNRKYETRTQVPETTLSSYSNKDTAQVPKVSGNICLPEVTTNTESSKEGGVGRMADEVRTVVNEAGYSWVEDLRVPLAELDHLPDQVNDPEFENRLKVFNNYRQFGLMYSSKGNNKVRIICSILFRNVRQKNTKIFKNVF